MKRFIFIIFSIVTLLCNAQIKFPDLSDLRKPILDSVALEYIIRYNDILDQSDIAEVNVTGIINFNYDTVNNIINYNIEDKYLLYFRKKNLYYYFEPKTDIVQNILTPIEESMILLPAQYKSFIKTNSFSVYLLDLFPFRSFYLDLFFLKIDQTNYFFGRDILDKSLDKVIEYNFGSVQNYVEIYKKRLNWRAHKLMELHDDTKTL